MLGGLGLGASSALAAASNSITLLPDGLEAQQGALRLHVTALSDDLLRVRVAPDGRWGEDASWVVSPDTRHHSVHVQSYGGAAPSGFRTAHLIVRLEREPLRLIIENAAGQLLSADALDRPVAKQGTGFELRKQLPESEHFVGLGDKLDHSTAAAEILSTGTPMSADSAVQPIRSIKAFPSL